MSTENKSVTKKWYDALTLELRLRGADGRTTGDAVATVRAHCAESGETPFEAFGEPRTYAESLALPARSPVSARPWNWTALALSMAAGLLGVGLAPMATTALRTQDRAELSWGAIAMVPTLAVVVALAFALRKFLLRRPVLGVLFLLASSAGLATVREWLGQPALTMPPWWALGIATVLLAASVIGQRLTLTGEGDPLVDPVGGPGKPQAAAPRVLPWIYVIGAAGLSALAWFTAR